MPSSPLRTSPVPALDITENASPVYFRIQDTPLAFPLIPMKLSTTHP
jgi:hypothetical protein